MFTSLVIFALTLTLLTGCSIKEVKNEPVGDQKPSVEVETEVPTSEPKTTNEEKGEKEEKEKEEPKKVLNYKTYEDEATGWMVFESLDEELKFSFKYPKDFSVSSATQDTQNIKRKIGDEWYIENYLVGLGKDYGMETQNPFQYFHISISIIDKLFNEWKEIIIKNSSNKDFNSGKCGQQKISITESKIDNNDALIQTISCPSPIEGYPGDFKTIFIQYNDRVLGIHTDILNIFELKWSKIFNQFLKSFKLE